MRTVVRTFHFEVEHICGTIKCENASICEKVTRCEEIAMLNVKIGAICEKNILNVKCLIYLESLMFSHFEQFLLHIASIFT